MLLLVLASALACAVLIGFIQKLVLESYINVGRQWVVATASGIVVLWPLAISVFFLTETVPIPDWPGAWEEIGRWGWVIAWVITGVAQYLVLRQHLRRAGSWVLANSAAGIIGLLSGSFVSSWFSTERYWPEMQPDLYAPTFAWIVGITVATLITGAVTATALVWLLQEHR